jgi:hypothetical protein
VAWICLFCRVLYITELVCCFVRPDILRESYQQGRLTTNMYLVHVGKLYLLSMAMARATQNSTGHTKGRAKQGRRNYY